MVKISINVYRFLLKVKKCHKKGLKALHVNRSWNISKWLLSPGFVFFFFERAVGSKVTFSPLKNNWNVGRGRNQGKEKGLGDTHQFNFRWNAYAFMLKGFCLSLTRDYKMIPIS